MSWTTEEERAENAQVHYASTIKCSTVASSEQAMEDGHVSVFLMDGDTPIDIDDLNENELRSLICKLAGE